MATLYEQLQELQEQIKTLKPDRLPVTTEFLRILLLRAEPDGGIVNDFFVTASVTSVWKLETRVRALEEASTQVAPSREPAPPVEN